MTCNCGTGFCFICGEEADGDSDHWSRKRGKSGCPRYHHPDDVNAEYDDGYDDDDEDSIAPTSDELGSEVDPLENVRDLFEVDEVAVDEAIVHEGVTTPPARTMDEWHSLSTLPGGITHRAGFIHTLHLARLAQNEAVSRASIDVAAEAEPGTPVISDRQELVSQTEGMPSMFAHDAAAIQEAYLEDDLSEEERGFREVMSSLYGPVLTMEEADIDRTLWRMRVD